MTYQQAYDKIIEAYFKDEIKPYDANFCFCGTLCGGYDWSMNSNYTGQQVRNMEAALLITLRKETVGFDEPVIWKNCSHFRNGVKAYYEYSICEIEMHKNYEDALFAAMSAALYVLKEIHRSRGEDVDNISKPFTKRQLI